MSSFISDEWIWNIIVSQFLLSALLSCLAFMFRKKNSDLFTAAWTKGFPENILRPSGVKLIKVSKILSITAAMAAICMIIYAS